MGAQPSSAGAGAAAIGKHTGSGSPLRNVSLGSAKAASFASSASEPTATPTRKSSRNAWVRSPWQASKSASSSIDHETGQRDLEAGPPSSPSSAQAPSADLDTEPTMFRRPSKMSVDSFGPLDEVITKSDSRPSSAQSRPSSSQGFGRSQSGSVTTSRPASASSRTGQMKMPRGFEASRQCRDPELVKAERLAKLSLEKLTQEDFIAREAWGGAATPSTSAGTPMSLSRAASSQSSSVSGSRPASSAASVSSSSQSNDPNVKVNLKEARQRAKASMQALQSELMGSAKATPARYSTWPIGCAVRVTCEDSLSAFDNFIPSDVTAILVSYDEYHNTFVVKLDDGSTRMVPAKRVNRVRARDRIQSQSSFASEVSASSTHGAVSSAARSVEATSYQAKSPPHLQSPYLPEPEVFGRIMDIPVR